MHIQNHYVLLILMLLAQTVQKNLYIDLINDLLIFLFNSINESINFLYWFPFTSCFMSSIVSNIFKTSEFIYVYILST